MPANDDKVAVVTGAGQGIGRAVAGRLAAAGYTVVVAGRTMETLAHVCDGINASGGKAVSIPVDLASDASIDEFTARVHSEFESIQVLVNCAGQFLRGEIQTVSSAEFQQLWAINVLGTTALTRSLVDALVIGQGDIVFVNSTSVFSEARGMGCFAATQHALRSLADTLRAEINDSGVRVLTVYPGRTATPRQKKMHAEEGREYRQEILLQPEDVAEVVHCCTTLPRTAEVMDLRIRPRQKYQ